MAADDAAVTVVLRANLRDYEAALKNAVRATERAAKAAEGAIANVGKKGGGGQVIEANFAKSSKAIANDARVLQFQLNDIFSGIASGQGVRAVQVQLGQIAQLLSGQSLLGGARTLAGALAGMINPINLAVVAFGVLAGIAASYFTSSIEKSKKATDELRKQADELDKLADKYGKLFPELTRLANAQREAADAAERNLAMQTALAGAYEKSSKAVDDLNQPFVDLISQLADLEQPTSELQKQFNELTAKLADHTAKSEDAKEVLAELNKIIVEQHGTVQELARRIRDELVKALGELDRAAGSAGETLKNLANQPGPGAGSWLTSPERLKAALDAAALASDAAEFIKREEGFISKAKFDVNAFRVGFGSDTFVDKLGQVQQVTKDTVVTLEQANQDLARRIPEFQKTITDAIGSDLWETLTKQQQAALTSIAYNFGRLPDKIVKALQTGDQGKVADAIANLSGNKERRAREAAPFGGVTTSGKALTDLRDWNVETAKRIELEKQVAAINAQVGLTETERSAQIEALRIAEEELNRLRKAGVDVTAEMEASIRALAQAQADATARSQEAATAQKAFTDQQRAAAQQAAQLQQQFAGLLSGALQGFTHDLMAGKDAGEAFSNMIRNLASQIVDLIIQMMIVKPLMQSLFGGGAGAGLTGGGLFHAGGTVGLSGQRDHRRFSPITWAGAPRFAAGGMVGLRPGEIPIIAHRGELVVPNPRRLAGNAAPGGSQARTVNVVVTAYPSPMLDLKIEKSSRQAEERAIARGPVVARNNNQRFAVP